jgi:hypothetical protein
LIEFLFEAGHKAIANQANGKYFPHDVDFVSNFDAITGGLPNTKKINALSRF